MKKKAAWGVFTKAGRLRKHLYLKRRDAKEDSITVLGDKVRKVEVRY